VLSKQARPLAVPPAQTPGPLRKLQRFGAPQLNVAPHWVCAPVPGHSVAFAPAVAHTLPAFTPPAEQRF